MTAIVPVGVSATDLERALDAFAAALGSDRVLTTDEELAEFRDPFQPVAWDDYAPSAVVMPETVEEVQAVVRIANEHRVPLWTHSQGRNNGYGGAAPRVKGSVTVSLRRMNRILELDGMLGYAVVEPGVRWFDLYEAIRAGGHRLMLSIADLGWGSVLGNSLDHGVTYLPYGQDFTAPCGLEVVLANGDVLRMGMGAMPGNRAWHLYKRGLGPTLDPLFMQSNFGIVTKMGVWLMPYPETYVPIWVTARREEDLVPIVDTMRVLRLDRTIEGVPTIFNTLVIASVFTQRSQWYDGSDPLPDPVIDEIAAALGLGRWTMRMALYEDEVIADHKLAKIKAAFERIPGVEVRGQQHAPEDAPALENFSEQIMAGVPNLEFNQSLSWYGGGVGGHVGFSPVVPLEGRQAYELHKLLRGLVEREMGLDYFVGQLVINARSLLNVCGAVFDVANEAETRRAYDACKLLVHEAAKGGYGEYRAHLDFMDLAAEQFSFGDHAYRRFCERIKDAVDPNGILSPGKQGIWPKQYR